MEKFQSVLVKVPGWLLQVENGGLIFKMKLASVWL